MEDYNLTHNLPPSLNSPKTTLERDLNPKFRAHIHSYGFLIQLNTTLHQ